MIGSVACRWTIPGRRALLVLAAGALAGCGAPADSVRFAAIGDIGTGGPGQKRVAAAIASRARDEPIDFIVTLGDNFYPSGVLGVDDPQWRTTIEGVYADPALAVPFHPTLGNHDHQGLPYAQVWYSRRSGRWQMPAPYYAYAHVLADGTRVDFFALDTEMIRGGLDGVRDPEALDLRIANVRRGLAWWDAELSDQLVRFIAERVHHEDTFTVSRILHLARRSGRAVDEELVRQAIAASVPEDWEAQVAWLDGLLARSTADWKIVYGHHPLYGHEPSRGHQRSMIARLEPVLVARGVDLYVAGHDHVTDVMKPIRGVHHVTSGGGAGNDHPYPIDDTDESYYVESGGGFTLYRVSAERLVVEVVDPEGKTAFELVVPRSER